MEQHFAGAVVKGINAKLYCGLRGVFIVHFFDALNVQKCILKTHTRTHTQKKKHVFINENITT